jgi:hypothetical protein
MTIGIENCVKELRNWKNALDVLSEELHISMKVIQIQKGDVYGDDVF